MNSPTEYPEIGAAMKQDLRMTEKTADGESAEQMSDFDVFLCYNSADKPEIRWVADRLRERGIRSWLDEDELPPGQSWQEELEWQLEHFNAAAVFFGPNGIGPWQKREIRVLLNESAERQSPVIPVLLPGAVIPPLPLFMKGFTWVHLKALDDTGIDLLVWGITGEKPKKSR